MNKGESRHYVMGSQLSKMSNAKAIIYLMGDAARRTTVIQALINRFVIIFHALVMISAYLVIVYKEYAQVFQCNVSQHLLFYQINAAE